MELLKSRRPASRPLSGNATIHRDTQCPTCPFVCHSAYRSLRSKHFNVCCFRALPYSLQLVIDRVQFSPRDAVHSAEYAQCCCKMSVRPSICMYVCLSVTRRYLPSSSHAILVYPHQTVWQYSDGDHLTGTLNAEGV